MHNWIDIGHGKHVKCMLDITIPCLYQYNLETICIYQSINRVGHCIQVYIQF